MAHSQILEQMLGQLMMGWTINQPIYCHILLRKSMSLTLYEMQRLQDTEILLFLVLSYVFNPL